MNFLKWIAGLSTAMADEAVAADAAAMPQAGIVELLVSLLPMLLIVVVFYFMLIRPQRKKDKQVKEMLNNLKHGDRVCTIGGIYGTVTNIHDDTLTLSVGKDSVPLVVARWAIRNVEEIKIENDAESLN